MLWLWILGGIVFLFVLFCLLRLGVLVRFGKPVYAWLRLGPFKIQLAPGKPEKETKKKPVKKKKEKDWSAVTKKFSSFPKPSRTEIKEAISALWPPMKRALERTRRGVGITPLQLALTFGGKDDPAAASEYYGLANAAVWSVMPALEQLLTIPNPGIHIGIDYDASKTEFQGEAGLSVRIGTLLAIGFTMLFPTLRWFLQYRKRHRNDAGASPQTTGASQTPAA